MNNDVLICGYSYHSQHQRFNWQSGLPYYFFRLQRTGNCQATINGKTMHIGEGDLLLCKPGDTCLLTMKKPSGDYYMMCNGTWLDQWWTKTARPVRETLHNDTRLIVLWKEIMLEKRRISDRDEQLLDYLLRALCLSIDNVLQHIHFDAAERGTAQPALRMRSFIEEHAHQSFRIKDVAHHVGFSVSHAAHLFKERFGKTMIEYALEIRLNTALELIQYSEMTMEQIADHAGFHSYTYFHRVFRQRLGMSPTAYVKQAQQRRDVSE